MLRLGLIVLGALLLQPALARKDDRSQPMRVVHADSFSGFNAPNSITTLTGHVELTQGTLKITGDLAKIYVDADQQLSRIVVTGNAHIQQQDDSGNLMTGDARTLDYDNIKGIATLQGQAAVHQQGRGEAHGDTLTYNTQTSQMTGSSGNDGMVHMIFLPKPQPASAPAPKDQPAAASTSATPAAAASSPTPQDRH
ncbi:MAG TPA: lipopolysaccharide transport periplasmic protein LptA [Rhodanobacter sp.]|nr:lipopolysaccharide transport periplasmic protein LptA [Rhodanobacter sp.]